MSKVSQEIYEITNQHTYIFSETGESVTSYICNTKDRFAMGIALNHKGQNIKWTQYYEGILQIQSKVNPSVWYIYLSSYWSGGNKDIPVERVMMVLDCNWKHNKKNE